MELHDIVRISNGDRIIITGFNSTRPRNKYRGVLETGPGKEYIFGDKHKPVVFGHAAADHPALLALARRAQTNAAQVQQAATSLDATLKVLVKKLVRFVLSGDSELARILATTLQESGILPGDNSETTATRETIHV